MILTAIFLAGLACLALVIWRRLFIIPAVVAAYYFASSYVPNYFGYSIDAQYLDGREALVLAVVKFSDVYLVVRMEGDKEPRLVHIGNMDGEAMKKLQEQAERGNAIVRFGNGKGGNGGGDSSGSGGVELVPLEKSHEFGKQPS